jgi:hypothetical protein
MPVEEQLQAEQLQAEQPQAVAPDVTRAVDFYGEELVLAIVEGQSYVALRPFCDYLGLDWSSQLRRTKRDRVLTRHLRDLVMTGQDGRQREMSCLQLEYLPGWLFGVTPSKARSELEEKLTQYREECFDVLWRAFQSELLQASGLPATTTPATSAAALVQVREIALAVAAMAEQQLALQEQMGGIQQRLDRAAVVVGDLQRRVSIVEDRTAPTEYVSEAQATEISARVKALAELLTEKDASKNTIRASSASCTGASEPPATRPSPAASMTLCSPSWRTGAWPR